MQAERVILETDENGHVSGLPELAPSSTIEAIFVVLDSRAAGEGASGAAAKSAPKTGKDLVQLFNRLSALCSLPTDDDFSGEDHDKVLYGWEKKS
jgi:hypothetical protein